jgi:hypothetical protein
MSETDEIESKYSRLATASFLIAIAGTIFQIIRAIIYSNTKFFRDIDENSNYKIIILSVFFIIADITGIVLGIISNKKNISKKWRIVVGIAGNAYAIFIFLVTYSLTILLWR